MPRTRLVSESGPDSLPDAPGVYLLTNDVSGDSYVGSAMNVRSRIKDHLSAIKTRKCSRLMLRAVERHGSAFTARLLEQCPCAERRNRERAWVAKLRPTLNRAPVNDNGANIEETAAIGLTLSSANLDGLRELADAMEFKPRISQLVNAAIAEFLERQKTAARKPPPRPA